MGGFAYYFSSNAIFLIAAILCIPTLIAVAQIRAEDIDYARARNAKRVDHSLDLQRIVDLAKNRNLLIFGLCITLFHSSNASALPLVAQNLGDSGRYMSPLFMAATIVVPQIVVAILAPWIGYWSELWGRKPLLVVGFTVLVARVLLFAFFSAPVPIIAIQILDGITGAVMTVLTAVVLTDITAGTGRFNLAQGTLGTITSAAMAASVGIFGIVAYHAGDVVAFLTMGSIAVAGMALLWLYMPETKPEKYED
jgi:MFS family permease